MSKNLLIKQNSSKNDYNEKEGSLKIKRDFPAHAGKI
jgi:hypothetical protein